MTRRKQPAAFALLCAAFALTALTFTATPAHASTTWEVSRTSDDVSDPTADCPGADCTLRGAVASSEDGDVIELAAGTFELDEQIVLTDGITITGDGQGNTSVRPATGDHRSFEIDAPGKNVRIESLTIRDGGGTSLTDGGAGLRVEGAAAVIIDSVTFENNDLSGVSGAYGGAVFANAVSSGLSVSNSTFSNNHSVNGGAVYLNDVVGEVEIRNTSFRNNSASAFGSNGGAIVAYRGQGLVISTSTFRDNSAQMYGGAIHLIEASSASVSRSTFIDNSSNVGGAIGLLDGSSISVVNSTFNANTGDGSLVATPSGSNEATIRFSTIVSHVDTVDADGNQDVAINDSALNDVHGCAPADVVGSFRDAASDAACGEFDGGDLGLIDDLIEPYFVPRHDSPLLLASSGACPDDDQRGVSRPAGPCAVGSIDQAGLTCPAGPLDRDVPVTCQLDVALHGPDTSVEVVHGADNDQFDTAVSQGRGDLTFVLSPDEPATTVDIAVGGGAYDTTLPVVPIGGGGGTGGGGSGGDSGGGGGGADTNGGGSDNGPSLADDDDVVGAVGGATDPEYGADRPMLAATGTEHTTATVTGLLAIAAGITVLRTGPGAIARVRDGR